MKRSLAHLPPERAERLREIHDVIRDATGVQFAMLILFGSYARGDWVDDEYQEGHITYSYRSDFDLLLLVDGDKSHFRGQRARLQSRVEKALRKHRRDSVNHPAVHIIVHTVDEMNKHLQHARYFWSDIKREGVLLATSGEHKLARVRKITPESRQRMAKEEFKNWFGSAKRFHGLFGGGRIDRVASRKWDGATGCLLGEEETWDGAAGCLLGEEER